MRVRCSRSSRGVMVEFDDLRRQLRNARALVEAAEGRATVLHDRIRRIVAREVALDRVLDSRNPQTVEERNQLREEKVRAEAELTRIRAGRTEALAAEAALLNRFASF